MASPLDIKKALLRQLETKFDSMHSGGSTVNVQLVMAVDPRVLSVFEFLRTMHLQTTGQAIPSEWLSGIIFTEGCRSILENRELEQLLNEVAEVKVDDILDYLEKRG